MRNLRRSNHHKTKIHNKIEYYLYDQHKNKTQMGNIIPHGNVSKTPECFVCAQKINTMPYTKCLRCNTSLHNECEQLFKESNGNIHYCVCPRCDRCGSLLRTY